MSRSWCGYALLGATWLIWKTEGGAQATRAGLRRGSGSPRSSLLAAVSVATPFLAYDYWRRWFAMPAVLLTAPGAAAGGDRSPRAFFWSLRRGAERLPFLLALGLFLLGFVGLGISIYPYVVPRAVTIWEAAAPPQSQLFMLVGAVVIVPVILAYTGWAYWVFRGKVGTHGYH